MRLYAEDGRQTAIVLAVSPLNEVCFVSKYKDQDSRHSVE